MIRPWNCHDWMYEFSAPYGEYTCVYCGEVADTVDHAPALWAVHARLSVTGATHINGCRKFPACRECNGTLGACVESAMTDRRRICHKRLRRRYARILAIPQWDEADLLELKPTLQQVVRVGINQRERMKLRLRFPEHGVSMWRTA